MAGVAGTIGKSIFFKLAGVSGALGVALGAYGSHGKSLNKPGAEKFKEVFERAHLYHMLHTIALLAAPFAQRPNLVGGLMCTGMTLFCGSCYAVAFSQNRSVGRLAPFGGTLLIIAWATFLF